MYLLRLLQMKENKDRLSAERVWGWRSVFLCEGMLIVLGYDFDYLLDSYFVLS